MSRPGSPHPRPSLRQVTCGDSARCSRFGGGLCIWYHLHCDRCLQRFHVCFETFHSRLLSRWAALLQREFQETGRMMLSRPGSAPPRPNSSDLCGDRGGFAFWGWCCTWYRGTSLIRNTPLLGPYNLASYLGSYGGPRGRGCFS